MSTSVLARPGFSCHYTVNIKGGTMTDAVKKGDSDLYTIVSIFHFVVGGFQILLSSIGIIYMAIGYLIATGAIDSAKSEPPPEVMGWIFSGLGLVFTVVLLTLGILVLRTGLNFMKKRNRTFCIVIDAILCLMMPFGTIVGIFGLVLLMKPETEELFTG